MYGSKLYNTCSTVIIQRSIHETNILLERHHKINVLPSVVLLDNFMSLAGYKLDEDLVLIAQIMALPFVQTLCMVTYFYLCQPFILP